MIRTRMVAGVVLVLMVMMSGCATDAVRKPEADLWDEYLQFSQRYFYLDRQDFDSITCRLDIPLMNNTVSQVRQLVVKSGGAVVVEENIDTFSVIFGPETGTDFILPELKVSLVSEENIADAGALKSGIELIERGIDAQIQGAAMSIRGIIGETLAPEREKIVLTKFEGRGGDTHIEYTSGDLSVTEVHGDITVEVVEKEPGSVSGSRERYEKAADGKLRLSEANVKVDSGGTVIEFDLGLRYQEVDGVVFFESITSDMSLQIGDNTQKAFIEYYFRDCKVKK